MSSKISLESIFNYIFDIPKNTSDFMVIADNKPVGSITYADYHALLKNAIATPSVMIKAIILLATFTITTLIKAIKLLPLMVIGLMFFFLMTDPSSLKSFLDSSMASPALEPLVNLFKLMGASAVSFTVIWPIIKSQISAISSGKSSNRWKLETDIYMEVHKQIASKLNLDLTNTKRMYLMALIAKPSK